MELGSTTAVMSGMTEFHSASEYRRFAAQCTAQAKRAGSPLEADFYLTQAKLWRLLSAGRAAGKNGRQFPARSGKRQSAVRPMP